jgi:hypothetical protein
MKKIALSALFCITLATSSFATTTTSGNFSYRWYTQQGPKASDFSTSYCDPHFTASPKSDLTPQIANLTHTSLIARNHILKYLAEHSWQLAAFKKVSTDSLVTVLEKNGSQLSELMSKLGKLTSINQPGLALVRNLPGDKNLVVSIFCFPADFANYKNVRMKIVLLSSAPFKNWQLLKFSANTMTQNSYNWITSKDGHFVKGFLSEKKLAPFEAKQKNHNDIAKWVDAAVQARNTILNKLSDSNWSKSVMIKLGTSSLRESLDDQSAEKSAYTFNFFHGLGALTSINHPGQARLIMIGSKEKPLLKALFYFPASFKNINKTSVNMTLIAAPPYDTWKLENVYIQRNDKLDI